MEPFVCIIQKNSIMGTNFKMGATESHTHTSHSRIHLRVYSHEFPAVLAILFKDAYIEHSN